MKTFWVNGILGTELLDNNVLKRFNNVFSVFK